MPKKLRKRLLLLAAALLAVSYAAGYSAARSGHLLIHRATFANGQVNHHAIAVGDWGTGLHSKQQLASLCGVAFLPARLAESIFWTLRHPPGSAWPY